MNNKINIVIKSQGQPDGGEGHSAGQAIRGNAAGEEGLSANMRGERVISSVRVCRNIGYAGGCHTSGAGVSGALWRLIVSLVISRINLPQRGKVEGRDGGM